jgi:hypothetical protein
MWGVNFRNLKLYPSPAPQKDAGTHLVGGWVGPQRGSGRIGGEENLLSIAEFYIVYIELKNK